ncbi:hypothetical protein AMR41_08630 [Hapalosiphon sp. MRB220]|nr:hypothetical protein AMR41_08630 [Hapalosiphon sp. MRB220]
MSSEPIKRNRYSEPPRNEGNFSARNFDEDFTEFHLPLNRMQLANFQQWGVAQGLEVSGSIGGTSLTVAPGVAVDRQGQLISLSSKGKGDIGKNPPSEDHEEAKVPVVLDLKRYTQTPDKPLYLTIQFSQILRFDEGPLGRYEHAPWLRLQPVNGFVDDGTSVVLARVVVRSNGELTELKAQGRRLVSKTVQELLLRRSQIVGEQVKQVSAGKLAATDQGLQLSVPDASNEVLLSQENGNNFARLEVHTDTSNFTGKLNVNQDLQVTGAIASSSLSVTGNCDITQDLQVTGAIATAILNTSELAVTSNANIDGNLRVSGNLEVQGNVTARDVEHVSGNVSLGDADNDEVKIAGVLRSGHSSGTLRVDDALHTTENLTIEGSLGIGTTNPGAKLEVNGSGGQNVDFIVNGRLRSNNNDGGLWVASDRFVGGHDTNKLGFWNGDAWQLTVQNDGNVGIGTTNPGAKLNIIHQKQDAHGNAFIIGPTNQSNLRLGYHQDYSWIQSHGNKPLAINSVGNNVGIGTTNPGAKLHIVDNNQKQFAHLIVESPSIGGTWVRLHNTSNGARNWSIIASGAENSEGAGKLMFHDVTQGTRMLIDQQGNVGIGTTNPSGTLDVNGDIRIKGSKPFMVRKYEGFRGDYNTGILARDWEATIAGFQALEGDINENDKGNIIQIYPYINGNQWSIYADFRSHNHHEYWNVWVLFIRKELVG